MEPNETAQERPPLSVPEREALVRQALDPVMARRLEEVRDASRGAVGHEPAQKTPDALGQYDQPRFGAY